MNYMAVAFQKVRQACRNGENSSFPNGSSLRKVETLTAIMRLKNEWRFERSSSTKLERDNRRGVEEVTTRPREEWWSFLSSSFHPFSPPSCKKGTEWEGIAG